MGVGLVSVNAGGAPTLLVSTLFNQYLDGSWVGSGGVLSSADAAAVAASESAYNYGLDGYMGDMGVTFDMSDTGIIQLNVSLSCNTNGNGSGDWSQSYLRLFVYGGADNDVFFGSTWPVVPDDSNNGTGSGILSVPTRWAYGLSTDNDPSSTHNILLGWIFGTGGLVATPAVLYAAMTATFTPL